MPKIHMGGKTLKDVSINDFPEIKKELAEKSAKKDTTILIDGKLVTAENIKDFEKK